MKKLIDINTGHEVEYEKGNYVMCTDITIDENYFEPALLLKDNSNQEFLFALDNKNLDIPRILTRQEAEAYKKRFGHQNWQAILNENVRIGFSEEMTLLSWGKPDRINRSSYGDQWVYGSQYLYFKGGKLQSFN